MIYRIEVEGYKDGSWQTVHTEDVTSDAKPDTVAVSIADTQTVADAPFRVFVKIDGHLVAHVFEPARD